jgi:hypothetical protein
MQSGSYVGVLSSCADGHTIESHSGQRFQYCFQLCVYIYIYIYYCYLLCIITVIIIVSLCTNSFKVVINWLDISSKFRADTISVMLTHKIHLMRNFYVCL